MSDETPFESAKQRSRRIPLDYYKGLTRLDWIKWLLTGTAVCATAAYVLWTLVGWQAGNEQAARQFSPAPVAGVHAVWDGNCAACHVAGVSLRQDGQAMSFVAAALAGQFHRDHQASDARCQNCHAGPPHHANEMAGETWSCAGCHRDHQGRNADLTRVADAACTRCHADLAKHRDGPPLAAGNVNVTSFANDHPPFRSAQERDPGRLRFNHRLHMLPGQYAAGAKASGKRTLADIPSHFRAGLVHPRRVEDVPLSTVVELDCAYCHEPDAGGRQGGPEGVDAIPASGAYMQPIDYERHCAACHNGDLVASVSADGTASVQQLPHGLGPAAIGQMLAGLASPPAGREDFSPEAPLQPIPGKTPGENLAQTTEPSAVARIAAAQHDLTGGHRCGKCHEFQDTPLLAVAPTAVPEVWLVHARFDHSAHRAMQCYDCHDRGRFSTNSPDKPALDDKQPILPDIDNCRRCHAPTSAAGTAGARHDCAECHRYHGSDLPSHGRGSAERGVPLDRRLDGLQWLSGQQSPR